MGAVARRQLPLRPAGPDTVAALLDWYDSERRVLPWRAAPGRRADPYRVWLSEIMLQQTTVKAVIPYYLDFIATWPSIRALADASLDEVLSKWAGLGYYSRARNLHKCAQVVAREHGGRFPRSEVALRKLPGIGPYTAAAIAAIAFNETATPVDGNIERVIARLFALRLPLPAAKPEIKRLASTLVPGDRPGDFAQAMMDLGATVCTPKRPSCLMCPIQSDCHGYAKGGVESLPIKPVKADRPTRFGYAFLALSEDGQILLRRRREAGLLGGMMEIPSTEWLNDGVQAEDALRAAPFKTDWWPVAGTVTHTFTHFRLVLSVYRAIVRPDATLTFWSEPNRCRWVKRHDLENEALPTLMRKVIAHALPQSFRPRAAHIRSARTLNAQSPEKPLKSMIFLNGIRSPQAARFRPIGAGPQASHAFLTPYRPLSMFAPVNQPVQRLLRLGSRTRPHDKRIQRRSTQKRGAEP